MYRFNPASISAISEPWILLGARRRLQRVDKFSWRLRRGLGGDCFGVLAHGISCTALPSLISALSHGPAAASQLDVRMIITTIPALCNSDPRLISTEAPLVRSCTSHPAVRVLLDLPIIQDGIALSSSELRRQHVKATHQTSKGVPPDTVEYQW